MRFFFFFEILKITACTTKITQEFPLKNISDESLNIGKCKSMHFIYSRILDSYYKLHETIVM